MNDSENLVIRRVKKVKKHGAHGGAWKIALADFALAMMAFFLVLWIINVSSPEELAVIEGYFNDPLGPATAGFSANPIDLGGSPAKSIERKLQADLTDPGSTKEPTRDVEIGSGDNGEKLEKLNDIADDSLTKLKQIEDSEKNVKLEITPEGVRVTFLDDPENPMFEKGSDRMLPDIENLMLSMGAVIKEIDNPIVISGHTDSSPFGGGELNNWDLSSRRANSARRIMEESGVEGLRIAQVVGLADSIPYDQFNLESPQNRRITITILNDDSYQELIERNRKRFGFESFEQQIKLDPESVF
ncbi:OmpA family protein [Marinomonas sp. 15G1-11]|uniref:OmpA family protein n=1 Tax=Marinomonas phaeophyticola TaxID=3004091 RepID=A0ABT4JXR8_9GAMM|nr:flagellar motor protein MotB [Marinomonas sp. 15G1-11]MCZ2723073.1 OmpA family protein [Marinomonas sp. 15G1-11]